MDSDFSASANSELLGFRDVVTLQLARPKKTDHTISVISMAVASRTVAPLQVTEY